MVYRLSMRDGPLRRAIKAIARANTTLNLRLTRLLWRLGGQRPYQLGGACGGCAKCCEAPSIAVGRALWYLPLLRRAFLAYHRVINGFELVDRERQGRVFVFRCTHFDPATRRCDSYDSRPAMCRDYPRALLHQPWPELFEGCGYRPIHPDGGSLDQALDRAELSEAQREALRRRLFLR